MHSNERYHQQSPLASHTIIISSTNKLMNTEKKIKCIESGWVILAMASLVQCTLYVCYAAEYIFNENFEL